MCTDSRCDIFRTVAVFFVFVLCISVGHKYGRTFRKSSVSSPAEQKDLDTWLQAVLFCKVEGVIVTGPSTGSVVAESDLRKVFELFCFIFGLWDESSSDDVF